MFLGSGRKGSIALVGVPFDGGSTGRPGSRCAPWEIRRHSHLLEEFSPYFSRELSSVDFVDLGDLEEFLSLEEIKSSLGRLFGARPSCRWVFLGGDHSITIPVVELLSSRFPSLFVLYMDAHIDLRDRYMGSRASHASVLRRVVEFVGKGNVAIAFGRSGDASEFRDVEALGVHVLSGDPGSAFEEALFLAGERPTYVSIDLDLFDPAFLPGTGVPEPGGIDPSGFFEAFPLVSLLNIVGADVVELNPLLDASGSSSVLAAKVVRELLIAMAQGEKT